MKITFQILIVLFLYCSSVSAQMPYIDRIDSTEFAYINDKGKVKFKFTTQKFANRSSSYKVSKIIDGVFMLYNNGKTIIINASDGKVIYETTRFKMPSWGHPMNKNGVFLMGHKENDTSSVENHLIDRYGKTIIQLSNNVNRRVKLNFSDFISICYNDGCDFYDYEGNFIFRKEGYFFRCRACMSVYNGITGIERNDYQGLEKLDGTTIIEPVHKKIEVPFSNEIVTTRVANIDWEGNELFPDVYFDIRPNLSSGSEYAKAMYFGKRVLISKEGGIFRFVLDYSDIVVDSDSLLLVNEEEVEETVVPSSYQNVKLEVSRIEKGVVYFLETPWCYDMKYSRTLKHGKGKIETVHEDTYFVTYKGRPNQIISRKNGKVLYASEFFTSKFRN